jgi:hypothetical protein
MIELKWCLTEVESMLKKTGWTIEQRVEPQINGYRFRKWKIVKDEHSVTLDFYHSGSQTNPVLYASDLFTYACVVKGTDITIGFLEYYQKDLWMESLRKFGEALNYNHNLALFGGHAITEMYPKEAIEIAETYIKEKQYGNVNITGVSWGDRWIDGHVNVDNQVWIVGAENLEESSFIDGNNILSFVVSWDSRKVEDVRSM